MSTGILVCGLNGAGKSTLGRALAEEMGFYFNFSNAFYSYTTRLLIPKLSHTIIRVSTGVDRR